MEKVKIVDLNAFKKYDELLKQWIASQFVYATEEEIMNLFSQFFKAHFKRIESSSIRFFLF